MQHWILPHPFIGKILLRLPQVCCMSFLPLASFFMRFPYFFYVCCFAAMGSQFILMIMTANNGCEQCLTIF